MRKAIRNEARFREYLEGVTYLKNGVDVHLTDKAINSRISRLRAVQELFATSLDHIVSNDVEMYKALTYLKEIETTTHQPLQNALRKYYEFKNNKIFLKPLYGYNFVHIL